MISKYLLINLSPQKNLVQFELCRAPDSINNIFSKKDKLALVVVINDYKIMWGNLRFILYNDLHSLTSFHMKKRGTILLEMKYLKKNISRKNPSKFFFLTPEFSTETKSFKIQWYLRELFCRTPANSCFYTPQKYNALNIKMIYLLCHCYIYRPA